MVADGFIKPLKRVIFQKFKAILGLIDGLARGSKTSGSF